MESGTPKPPVKMLALDLDGTLAVDGHGVLPATRVALEKLHNAGVEVVIATGRRYRTTRYVISNLGFDVFAVCNGGALVKSPMLDTVSETTFSLEQITSLVETARSHGLSLFAQRDAHARGGADFVVDDHLPWTPYVERYFKDNQEWSQRGDLLTLPPEFLVAGMMGEETHLNAFAEDVYADHGDMFNCIVVPSHGSNHFYCEVTQRHVDKWYGLQSLCAHFNITHENVCAAGDQINDVAMLEAATHSFAMSNGNPDIHKHAKLICGAHDEDGILEIIDYINRHNAAS